MPPVSVVLATTGRPEMAARVCAEIRATTAGHDVEIVAAVDHDPITLRQLAPPVTDTLLYSPEYRGCSRAWNDALAATTGDPVVLAADDLVFRDGWLTAALACLASLPDGWGLVGFNDGQWTSELSTHYLMSRRFIIEVLGGRIAWECYRHSFNDVEANERARRADRYRWCEDAHVTHRHWLFGGREQDATDRRALPTHPASEWHYRQREAAGFPDTDEAVISE